MNEIPDTTQGPFHVRLTFYKGKPHKPDYDIDNIVDEYSKNTCPLTKPKSQGADEVQQIAHDESGRWLILRNHDFSRLAQAGSKKCLKFPSKGSINLKFEVYNDLGVIYSLDTIFNKQNKELPPQAKIHVDKNHKENPLESDYLFLRTTDGYLTAIRFFLPDSLYHKALTQLRTKPVPKKVEKKDEIEVEEEELDSSNKENTANNNNKQKKKTKKTTTKVVKEDTPSQEPSRPSKSRKSPRRSQSGSISSQPTEKEEMEVVKQVSPTKKSPPKDNHTSNSSKVKLKNFDLFESTDSLLNEPDLDETTDNIEVQPVLGKHARETDESNQYGMVKIIRQTIQDTNKHKTTSPDDTTKKKTKTQEQSSSPMEVEKPNKVEFARKASFVRSPLKDSNGMEAFVDLRISNDAILLDSDNDNNNLDKSFHLFYEGTPDEEDEIFSQSFAEAKQQVHDTAEIDVSKLKYNHKELLGSGTFAKVFRGTYQGSLVAVKLFNHFGSTSHVKLEDTMRSESIIMKTMSHTNVVKWVGANWTERMILLELCTRGNLFSWIHSNVASPARKRTKAVFSESKEKPWNLNPFVNSVNEKHPLAARFESIAVGIAKGLQHIHNNEIIHCDISSMNILLDEKWVPKIADFGVSCMNKQKISSQNLGAPRWRAPEMYSRSKKKPQHIDDSCTSAVDIFAFAMVLFEIESLSLPFPNRLDPQVEDAVLLGGRPELPEMHPKLKELMEECWSENPEDRPTANQLVERLAQLNKHS